MQNTEHSLPRTTTPFIWRRAMRADAEDLLELIVALANFEKLPPPDADGRKRLVEHGFGERPKFESWLGFYHGVEKPVAYAVLFEAYSTFRADPTLYLEDLFVLPEYRKRGIGSAFLRQCVQMAYERGCGRMEWTCLDWNTKAQAVYEALGARRLSEWYLYRLTREDMKKLLSEEKRDPNAV
jgi:GNAT superfamily N-acetyltransferase